MAVHPLLEPGLSAYRAHDFTTAADLWRELGRGLEGKSAAACAALADLAAALGAFKGRDPKRARQLWTATRAQLAALPPERLGVDFKRLRERLPESPEEALARLPAIRRPPLFPRRAALRFFLFLLILATSATLLRFTPLGAYLSRDSVITYLGALREAWWAPLLLILLGAVLSPLGLPASPLMLAGALLYGAVWGSLYNFLAMFAGAVTSYWMARTLGRDLLTHIAGPRLRRIEQLLSRRGFGYLVGARFMPLPFPAVNFGMALAGVRFVPFALSSILGLAPALTVWTFFYASLAQVVEGGGTGSGEAKELVIRLFGAMFLLALVAMLPNRIRQLARRRRYREIRDQRGSDDQADLGL